MSKFRFVKTVRLLRLTRSLIRVLKSKSKEQEQDKNIAKINELKLQGRSPDRTEVETAVEELDKLAREIQNEGVRDRCLSVLAKICREQVTLPKSYIITGVVLEGVRGRSEVSDTWIGKYGEEDICCKIFRKYGDQKARGAFYSWIVRWRHLSHFNVLPLLGISVTKPPLGLVSPWMQSDILVFTEERGVATRLRLLREAVCGLEYLHFLGIAHGNIHPGNILITDDGIACIADLGIAQLITDPDFASTKTKPRVVHRYRAPEQVDHARFGLKKSDIRMESDIHSFAMTAYEVLTRTTPYQETTPGAMLAAEILKGTRPPYPGKEAAVHGISNIMWTILCACWAPGLRSRPTVDRVHRAFQSSVRMTEGSSLTHELFRPLSTQGPLPAAVMRSRVYSDPPRSSPRLLGITDVPSPDTQLPFAQVIYAALARTELSAETRNSLLDKIIASESQSELVDKAEVETIVETLDKLLRETEDKNEKDCCLRALVGACRNNVILPKSCIIPIIEHGELWKFGGIADIWTGKLTGKDICIKVPRKQGDERENIKRTCYHRVVRWNYLSHPNVLPFLGVSETFSPFGLVSPRMPNNILEYVRKCRDANRTQLVADAAYGVEYLHLHNIAHGSINPGNILITEEGKACVGDFEITEIITDALAAAECSATFCQRSVVRYLAPEQVDPSMFNLEGGGTLKESDVHSLAITAYEVLTGIEPYPGITGEGPLAVRVISGERPFRPRNEIAVTWLSDGIWGILGSCWTPEPSLRPPIKNVCRVFSGSVRMKTRALQKGGG